MPADGLTLAVLVGREVQLASALHCRTQVFHNVLAAHGQFVGRLEPIVDVNRQTLARKVRDMANGGANVVRVTEEFGDRFCLRGGFHDDEGFCHQSIAR